MYQYRSKVIGVVIMYEKFLWLPCKVYAYTDTAQYRWGWLERVIKTPTRCIERQTWIT